MLENMRDVNHLGETLNFGEPGLYVNSNTLRDYAWDYTTQGGRVSAFNDKTITEKPFTVVMVADVDTKNRIFEVIEKDVIAQQRGRLYIGDYYLSCYIRGTAKSDYLASQNYIKITLTVVIDTGRWTKESALQYLTRTASGSTDGMDYPHDYPIDYAAWLIGGVCIVGGFEAADYRMIIYGACTNPTVYIGTNTYQINETLSDGEYMTIDSAAKTITKTAINGVVTNIYNKRSRANYIFAKIPAGNNAVTWSGAFGFDLTVYMRRSEPVWT